MKFIQAALKTGQLLVQKVLIFTLAIGFVSAFWSAISLPQTPTDDFGFGAHRSSRPTSVAGMSYRVITAILSERMTSASQDQIDRLAKHIIFLCQRYHFDPAFILSMIQVESGFNPSALSPAGAVGLMQLMPATATVVVRDMNPPLDKKTLESIKKTATPENRFVAMSRQLLVDPVVNLTLGVAYLASLREHYRELHPYYVLAAYNMGPARIDELMSKKTFKPDKTKKYFEAIRQGTSQFRLYRANRRPAFVAAS
ncbi:MAG: lytic transglycosylase domain-containing protein [Bdellovibrionia bacterium]